MPAMLRKTRTADADQRLLCCLVVFPSRSALASPQSPLTFGRDDKLAKFYASETAAALTSDLLNFRAKIATCHSANGILSTAQNCAIVLRP